MADRIGVINRGRLVLVREKAELMRELGRKHLTLQLQHALPELPPALQGLGLELGADGAELHYTYDTQDQGAGMGALLEKLREQGVAFRDLRTTESTLEDIFVGLLHGSQA